MEAGNTRSKRKAVREYVEPSGFDVTCVVGRVEFGQGDVTPYQAAFQVIAEHGAQGSFTFPGEDGDVIRVTVEHELSPFGLPGQEPPNGF